MPSSHHSPLTLQTGTMHDIVISAVLRKLADHPPFRAYSLATIVYSVMAQLQHGANLMGLRDGKLVAYGGWLRVRKADAEAWLQGQAEIPTPDWNNGDAIVSTIIIADNPGDLMPLIRGISNACAGLPVYRMRVFEGRGEHRRKPITGRARG